MIKSLQTLRFVAILMVFASHLSFFTNYDQYKMLYNRVLSEGYSAVTFFIMLSGFVITYRYYDRIQNSKIKNVISFTFKRVKRLYPVHVITLVIALPLVISLGIDHIFMKVTLNILLLQSFIPRMDVYYSLNAVSWYLSVSVLFFLCTPIIITTIKKVSATKKLFISILVLYLVELCYVYFIKDIAPDRWFIYINPFLRLLDYTIGCLLGSIMIKNKEVVSKDHSTLLEFVSIGLFIVAYSLFPFVEQDYRYGTYYAPFFIFIIHVFSKERGWISQKVLSNKMLVYLGGISFEFYMIHQLVIRYLRDWLIINPVLLMTICLAISILLSIMINKILQKRRHQEIKCVPNIH